MSPDLGRLAQAARRRYAMFRLRGARLRCPCCERSFRAFLALPGRPDAVCPGCGSRERHRALFHYLRERTDLLEGHRSVLHFAPEHCLERRFRALPNLDYVTADLEAPNVMLRMDITRMPVPSASFDLIICTHVLEHVADDRAAMRELLRALKPGTEAILMFPIHLGLEVTLEDPRITDPQERRRVFGQEDHVRLYGRDVESRLRSAGFEVAVVDYPRELGGADARRYAMLEHELIFRCTKATPPVAPGP